MIESATEANDRADELAEIIGDVPAHTAAGIAVKARALILAADIDWPKGPHADWLQELALTIRRDVIGLAEGSAAEPVAARRGHHGHSSAPTADATLLALAPDLERLAAERKRAWDASGEDDQAPAWKAAEAAQEAVHDFAVMIGNIPARTLAGLRVKARALQVLGHEWCDYFDEQMPPETLAVQLAGDVIATADIGEAPRAASTLAAPSASVILDAGRRIKATVQEMERSDAPADSAYAQLLYDRCRAEQRLISLTKAETPAEAALQLAILSGRLESDIEPGMTVAEARHRGMCAQRLLRSALGVLVRETGIDLAEFGSTFYLPPVDPWREPAEEAAP